MDFASCVGVRGAYVPSDINSMGVGGDGWVGYQEEAREGSVVWSRGIRCRQEDSLR